MKFSVQTAVLPELTARQVLEKLSAHGYDDDRRPGGLGRDHFRAARRGV
jgi:hypothetical protein